MGSDLELIPDLCRKPEVNARCTTGLGPEKGGEGGVPTLGFVCQGVASVILFVVLCFLGMIVAWIAWYKGRNRHLWWIYGSLLFVVAFPHVLLIDRKPACPNCGAAVKAKAGECANCGQDL